MGRSWGGHKDGGTGTVTAISPLSEAGMKLTYFRGTFVLKSENWNFNLIHNNQEMILVLK